jgi:hypothetical protein
MSPEKQNPAPPLAGGNRAEAICTTDNSADSPLRAKDQQLACEGVRQVAATSDPVSATERLGRPRGTIVKPRNDDLYSLTRARAEAMAQEIRAFWEAKGRDVHIWLEPLNETNTVEWVVRSDLSLVERRS